MKEYRYILVPMLTLVLCQIIKFIIEGIKNKEFTLERLFSGSGGMPSSHTALSVSLAVMFHIDLGLSSPFTALAIVVALIVGYDGMNVRMESGKHAKLINEYMKKNSNDNFAELKEELGHRPKEVLVGVILGIIVPVCYKFLFLI